MNQNLSTKLRLQPRRIFGWKWIPKIRLFDFVLMFALAAITTGWIVDHYRFSWRRDFVGTWQVVRNSGKTQRWIEFKEDGTFEHLTIMSGGTARSTGEYYVNENGLVTIELVETTRLGPNAALRTYSNRAEGRFHCGIDRAGVLILDGKHNNLYTIDYDCYQHCDLSIEETWNAEKGKSKQAFAKLGSGGKKKIRLSK